MRSGRINISSKHQEKNAIITLYESERKAKMDNKSNEDSKWNNWAMPFALLMLGLGGSCQELPKEFRERMLELCIDFTETSNPHKTFLRLKESEESALDEPSYYIMDKNRKSYGKLAFSDFGEDVGFYPANCPNALGNFATPCGSVNDNNFLEKLLETLKNDIDYQYDDKEFIYSFILLDMLNVFDKIKNLEEEQIQ